MSAPLVTPSRDALAKALADHRLTTPVQCACGWRETDGHGRTHGQHVASVLPVIDAATLTDDETVRAVAYRFAEGEATYAASTVRHVLRALADVLAERGEQHG